MYKLLLDGQIYVFLYQNLNKDLTKEEFKNKIKFMYFYIRI